MAQSDEVKTDDQIKAEIDANLQNLGTQEETTAEVTEEKSDQRQYTEDEEKAIEHGWRPKDEWEGDPADWVSAKEFNKRASLFARIAKYGAENRELREGMKKLFDHNRRIFDAGYKKAMEDLKQQRFEAIEEGDTKKLVQVEEQMDNLKVEHANVVREFDESVVDTKKTGPTPEQQVLFENWLDANPWYGKNGSLTEIANNLASQIVNKAKQSGAQVEYGKLLNQVAREVRENNPDFFAKVGGSQKSGAVDGGSRSGTKRPGNFGGRYSLNSIPAEEREIAQTIMRSTGMKEEEYVKQYMDAQQRRGR